MGVKHPGSNQHQQRQHSDNAGRNGANAPAAAGRTLPLLGAAVAGSGPLSGPRRAASRTGWWLPATGLPLAWLTGRTLSFKEREFVWASH